MDASTPLKQALPETSSQSGSEEHVAGVYVTVYEYTPPLIGLPRTFMRHSGIVVQLDLNIKSFEVYHVIGTPGIGLKYQVVNNWNNPREQTASLLAMDLVAWVPVDKARELESLLGEVETQVSRSWNCQNWVREGLEKMSERGIITHQQEESAVEKQQQAVNSPYTGNTPNRQALD